MKLINVISNCKSLYFLANKVIYTVEYECEASTFINDISLNIYLSILKLSTYNNELYYFNDSKLYKIEKNKLVEEFMVEDVNKVEIISRNTLFSWKKISRKEYLYTIRDLNKQLLWSFCGSDSLTPFNDFILKTELFDDTKFEILDIKRGDPIWSYSLPKGFNIDNKPKLVNNILFFKAYNENQKNQLLTGFRYRNRSSNMARYV
ncbi:hypothetical protein EDL98_05245 [Ornithobacterium rhinotracheale]|nr:hypothetical protein [Ornithobacterium rhinotracheale]